MEEQKQKKKRKRRKILLWILAVLIIFRLFLPYIVLKYVNKQLSQLKEYYGHVEDIDIALYRGAYQIKGMRILKRVKEPHGTRDTIPFFMCREIDLSVEWKALFKGSLVGELVLDEPVLNFVKGHHKNEDVRADTSDFRDLINSLMPLSINHFDIHKGQLHYIDPESSPKVDISMKQIEVAATNLSNVNKDKKLLPAKMSATATAYGGSLKLNVNFDALNKAPTFDLNMEVTQVNMVNLNEFFQAYGNFDLKKGNFGLYTEFAAREGKFRGYVKPIIKDLDIVQWNKEEGNVGQILWETLIGSAAELLQNQRKEQLATKIPVEGSFENPQTNMWDAVSYVLRNAFVNALKPSIDNTINIANVESTDDDKTFLQKVFGRNKDKEKKKESKEEKK